MSFGGGGIFGGGAAFGGGSRSAASPGGGLPFAGIPAEASGQPGPAWPDPADPVFRYLGGEFTLPSRDAPIPPQ